MLKNKIFYSTLLISISLISGYVFVCYSHKQNVAYTFLPLGVLLISCLLLIYYFVSENIASRIPAFVKKLFVVFFFISIYSGLTTLQREYKNYQLEKNGVVVKGRVTGSYQTSSRGTIHYFVKIAYSYNKGNYEQSVNNDDRVYKYHDELSILCSSNAPELFRVAGYKPALDIKY
ncbi:MAG: hypothetical protein ACXVB0_19710 [Mucilaginibacter sp.]